MTLIIIWSVASAIVACLLTLLVLFIITYAGTLNIYTGDDLEKDIFRYDLAISFDELEKRKLVLMIVKSTREKNDLYDD